MNRNRMGMILRIAALGCVLVFVVGVLIYGIKTDFGFLDLSREPDDGVYAVSQTYEEEVKSLRQIHVDWVNGPVTLQFYAGDVIRITESAKAELHEDEKLYLELSGGELSVRWNSALLQWNTWRKAPKQLEILIPQAFYQTLEDVRIETVAGNVEIEGLTAADASFTSALGELHLKDVTAERFTAKTVSGNLLCQNITGTEELQARSNSGNITLAGITAGAAVLDTTSGDVTLSGSMTAVECETVSGDVQMDFAAWPEKTDLRAVSGSTEILAPAAEAGFVCRFTSVSGTLQSDFAMKQSGDTYTCGAGTYSVRLDTTSGDAALHQKVG